MDAAPEVPSLAPLLANRTLVGLVGLQFLGLFVSCTGLSTLPVGDNAYEVPNDRLQLAWFTTIWSLVIAGLAVFGVSVRSRSAMLLAMFLLSVASTVSMVYTNAFGGFTRNCHHCASSCPDYVNACNTGRSLFISGSTFQISSMLGLMFLLSSTRGCLPRSQEE